MTSSDPPVLHPTDLVETAATRLVRQEYGARPPIAGVVVRDVPVFRSPDGLFTEIMRLDGDRQVEGLPGFRPIQWNWSRLEPGAVKAWHVHFGQDDLWIVPPDASVLVGLVDLRKTSPSASMTQRLTLGSGRCHRLLIPRGVAHGVANLSGAPQSILYAVNQFFSPDPELTDEWRLPWDHFGAAFWQMERG